MINTHNLKKLKAIPHDSGVRYCLDLFVFYVW